MKRLLGWLAGAALSACVVCGAELRERPMALTSVRSAEMRVEVTVTNDTRVFAYVATSNAGVTVADWTAVTNYWMTNRSAVFSASLAGLEGNTEYWCRWRATNVAETAWSAPMSFVTLMSSTGTPSLLRRPLYVDGAGRVYGIPPGMVLDFGTNRVRLLNIVTN